MSPRQRGFPLPLLLSPSLITPCLYTLHISLLLPIRIYSHLVPKSSYLLFIVFPHSMEAASGQGLGLCAQCLAQGEFSINIHRNIECVM